MSAIKTIENDELIRPLELWNCNMNDDAKNRKLWHSNPSSRIGNNMSVIWEISFRKVQ